MVVQVRRLRPGSLLDLASGGGWFVGRFLYHNKTVRQCVAIERDLQCLWTLEYKFRHVSAGQRAEAVGGDVRALPVLDDVFDVVTCSNALGEIAGISAFLAEAYRVLRSGGHFLLCHSERPIRYRPLTLLDYRRLAVAADLFTDREYLLKLAEKVGFVLEDCVSTEHRDGTPRFVARLRKE